MLQVRFNKLTKIKGMLACLMKKTCYCSQELQVALEDVKGTSVGLRPAVKHLWPFLGQCNKLAIESLSQSPMHSIILLPEMTAANFNAWCNTVILEAAFLNKKSSPGLGQVHTNTHQAQTFKWIQLSVAHV